MNHLMVEEVAEKTGKPSDLEFKRRLLATLGAVGDGDFYLRLPSDWTDLEGKVAEAVNRNASRTQPSDADLAGGVRHAVGQEGQLGDLLPRPGVPVWVQCGACTTAAYRDAAGVWRSYARGQELKRPVRMLASMPWSPRPRSLNGREFKPLRQLGVLLSLMPNASGAPLLKS